MLDFIIVEDSKDVLKKIKNAIIEGTMDYKGEVNIHSFESYNDEVKDLINNEIINKVYILDIELPGAKSGIDIAQEIRNTDILSNIIMITRHDGLFEIVYRNLFNVSDFIEKIPGFERKLVKDIKVITDVGFDNGCLLYHNRDIDLQLSYRNILYIYRDTNERKIYIVTDTNSFALPISLIEVTKLLDNRFIQVHRACIVNKTRVTNFVWSKNYFVLDNGTKVDLLSRKYRSDNDHE